MIETFISQGVFFLMGISILTSKSGMSIFGLLLLVISFFPKNFALIKKNKIMWLVAGLFPLALITNLFSLGGFSAVLKVFQAFVWPLLVIPSALLVERRELRKFLFSGLVFGLVLGIGKTFWNLFSDNYLIFNSLSRMTGFWDLSRWAVFTGVSAIAIFWVLADPHQDNHKFAFNSKSVWSWLLVGLFFLTLFCLFLTGSRAPWIGTCVGLGVLFFFSVKAKKMIFGLFVLGIVAMLLTQSLRERITSIAEVKTEDGRITSSNISNAGRLHMWKVALDFYKEQPWFGTGLEMAEAPMRNFLANQSDDYRSKYTKIEFSYHDQHSTYLGVLVKMGIIFSLVFWTIIFYLAYLLIKNRDLASQNWLVLSIMVFHLIVFIFYTSFDSYEMISFFPLFVWARYKKD